MGQLIKLEYKPRVERYKKGERETTLEKLCIQSGERKTIFITYAKRGALAKRPWPALMR